jgi:ERF superfamily
MQTKNIYQSIKAVMLDIEPIAKDRKNTQQNYSFRGIDELMNMIAPLMTKHGIFPITQKVETILSEAVTSKSGGAGYHLINRYTFRLYAEDGTFLDTIADGEAIDYGDKSSNKAYSVAYREAMFKTFVIPFENDDIENASHDLQTEKKPAATEQPAKDTDHERKQSELASKIQIGQLMTTLTGTELKGATLVAAVAERTKLDVVPANFAGIIGRLEILIDEAKSQN